MWGMWRVGAWRVWECIIQVVSVFVCKCGRERERERERKRERRDRDRDKKRASACFSHFYCLTVSLKSFDLLGGGQR